MSPPDCIPPANSVVAVEERSTDVDATSHLPTSLITELFGGTGSASGSLMSDAYVIEVRTRTAGIVVRDGRQYCFFAAHHDFNSLERRLFASLVAAQKAATRCLNESLGKRR